MLGRGAAGAAGRGQHRRGHPGRPAGSSDRALMPSTPRGPPQAICPLPAPGAGRWPETVRGEARAAGHRGHDPGPASAGGPVTCRAGPHAAARPPGAAAGVARWHQRLIPAGMDRRRRRRRDGRDGRDARVGQRSAGLVRAGCRASRSRRRPPGSRLHESHRARRTTVQPAQLSLLPEQVPAPAPDGFCPATQPGGDHGDQAAGPADRQERGPARPRQPERGTAMNEPGKITVSHRRRSAAIYVRQSTLAQVERNKESTARQYDLVARAGSWAGWRARSG